MDTLYIETSIVSYLRQRLSSDLVRAARQVLTHRWWNTERTKYELVASQYVEEIHRIRREISDRFGGDTLAIADDAARRLAASDRPVWQPKTTSQAMHRSGEVERPADR